MAINKGEKKKPKIAWGITGAGDKIAEYIEAMIKISKEYKDKVEIHVFLSKAAVTVIKFYRLEEELKHSFSKVRIELNPNAPFLAAWMQIQKYKFLLIAPATSNTVAKIASSIGDSLLTNAAIMSMKAFVPVYIAPTDYEEGVVSTKLPNGKEMKLRVRKEEVEHVRKLQNMEDMFVLESPQQVSEVFKKWFK